MDREVIWNRWTEHGCGLKFLWLWLQSSELVDWADEGHHSGIYSAGASGCPWPPGIYPGPTACIHKNLSLPACPLLLKIKVTP